MNIQLTYPCYCFLKTTLPNALFSINNPLLNSNVDSSPFRLTVTVEEFVISQVKLTFCVLVIPLTINSPLPSLLNFQEDNP